MNKCVLLIVDVQTALIKRHPYNKLKIIDNIKKLITIARDNEIEVVYVRHDVNNGRQLEPENNEWDIYSEVAPNSGEVIYNKRFNSAFYKTGLKQYLDSKDIDTIILVGLQTEYCIDATCKSAFEHGYNVIIAEETNTTFDNEYLSADKLYEFYNFKIWNKRFANVLPVREVIGILSGNRNI